MEKEKTHAGFHWQTLGKRSVEETRQIDNGG
jgi:hypothetical protein